MHGIHQRQLSGIIKRETLPRFLVMLFLTGIGLGFINCTPGTKFQSQQKSELGPATGAYFPTNFPINIAIPPAPNGESFSGKLFGQLNKGVCSDGSIYRALILANLNLTQFMLMRYDCVKLDYPILLQPELVEVVSAGELIYNSGSFDVTNPKELLPDIPVSGQPDDPAPTPTGEVPVPQPTPTFPLPVLHSQICLIKFINSPPDQGFSLSLSNEKDCVENFNLHVQLNPGQLLAVYVVGVYAYPPYNFEYPDINAFMAAAELSSTDLVADVLGKYSPVRSSLE